MHDASAATGPTIQDVAGELRRTAESLRRAPAVVDRRRLTRDFWTLARMLRSAQPPLLLPHRSAPPARRYGYLIDPQNAAATAAIERAHSGSDDQVSLLVISGGRTVPPGSRAINLTGMSEAQAVRIIAQADLDALVDVDGLALAEAPLVVALHPARVIVEPWCLPAATGTGTGSGNQCAIPPGDIGALIETVRHAVPAVAALPDGMTAPELALMLDQAVRSHRSGLFETARAGYLAVLARYPDHPVALYLLGQLLGAHGVTDGAIAAFRRAGAVVPEFRDAHYALAQRLAEQGNWPEARRAYATTIELTPQFAAGWSGLGLSTLRSPGAGASAAVAHLERAVSIDPGSAQWRFNLGTACQRTGRLGDARDAYLRALELDPGHRDARFNLGTVLQELGDYRTAIAAYRRILADDPAFAAAYPELGTCLQVTSQIEAWRDNFHRFREHCEASLSMAVYGLEASMAAGDVDGHLH